VVSVQVDVPTGLSARGKALLAELDAELRGVVSGVEPQRKVASGK
jgi:hypothetical protein